MKDARGLPAVNEGTTRGFGGRNFIGGIAERQVCHRCQDARDKSKGRWLSPPPQLVRGHRAVGSRGPGGTPFAPAPRAGTFWRQEGGEAPRGWGQAVVRRL